MNDLLERHRRMVEQFPENELARFSLGKALFDAGQYQSARAELAKALEKKPDWMVAQILVARCDLHLGCLAEARAGLRRARELALAQKHEGPLAEVEQLLEDLGPSSV